MSVGVLGTPAPVVVAHLNGAAAHMVTDGTGFGSAAAAGWTTVYDPHGFVVGGDHFEVPAAFLPPGRRGVFLVNLGITQMAGPSPSVPAVTDVGIDVEQANSDIYYNQALHASQQDAGGSAVCVAAGSITQTLELDAGESITINPTSFVLPATAGAHINVTFGDWVVTYLGPADVP